MVCGYLAVLLLDYLRFGVLFQYSLGLYTIGALPMLYLLGRSASFLRNWIPFLVLLLAYEAFQGYARDIAGSGTVVSLYSLDRSLTGVNDLTGLVQSAFDSSFTTAVMTLVYSLHFPLIMVTSVFLWYTDALRYKKYVYSMVATSYLSLVTFIIMPTA